MAYNQSLSGTDSPCFTQASWYKYRCTPVATMATSMSRRTEIRPLCIICTLFDAESIGFQHGEPSSLVGLCFGAKLFKNQ